MDKEKLSAMSEKLAKTIGSPKKEGSNVVSFRCNARYQKMMQDLQKDLAPSFGLEVDDLPISTIIKFALEYTATDIIGKYETE